MRRFFAAAAVLALVAGCDVQDGSSADNAAGPADPPTKVAAAAAPLGEPVAREAALKLMHDRHENMESIGDALKPVNRTLKTDSPDLALIRSSAAKIADLAPHVPSWFPPGTGPDAGKTHAKPDIWQTPEDFAAKAHAMNEAAQAFHAAAQSGDLTSIKARFGELGKTCKACHDPYRTEHEH